MDSLGSFTLIVKAPNQKIEDKRVACDGAWTVRQLKEHLSTVYPEKPHKDQQKLVYFGKLLKDEACLHEVLVQESYDNAHTVHLVCPQQSNPTETLPKAYVPRFTTANEVMEQGTELRQRSTGVAPSPTPLGSQPDTTRYTEQLHYWNSYWQQMHNSQIAQAQTLTPQQRLWYQMYQQQAAAFNMQILNAMQLSQIVQPSVVSVHENNGVAQPANEEGQQEPAQQNNQDEVVQMNAQGGIDADAGQRDWLDNMYSFVRFGMLMMLLYFYTTFGRFSIVLAVGMFFYLAQGNFFRLQRRVPAPPAPQQPLHNDQNLAENQNNENNERDNNPVERTNHEQNNNIQGAEPNQGSWVDGFRVILTFIVTLFSSLIPQNPAAIPN